MIFWFRSLFTVEHSVNFKEKQQRQLSTKLPIIFEKGKQ